MNIVKILSLTTLLLVVICTNNYSLAAEKIGEIDNGNRHFMPLLSANGVSNNRVRNSQQQMKFFPLTRQQIASTTKPYQKNYQIADATSNERFVADVKKTAENRLDRGNMTKEQAKQILSIFAGNE